MNKYITGGIIGICITVTVLSVWQLFSMRSRIANLEVFATQVAALIKENSKTTTK